MKTLFFNDLKWDDLGGFHPYFWFNTLTLPIAFDVFFFHVHPPLESMSNRGFHRLHERRGPIPKRQF